MCFVGWDEQANVFLDITKIREKLGSVIGEGFILPNRLKPSLRVRKTEYQAILYFSITSLVPASTRWDKQLPAESKERTASLLRTHVVYACGCPPSYYLPPHKIWSHDSKLSGIFLITSHTAGRWHHMNPTTAEREEGKAYSDHPVETCFCLQASSL